MWIMRGPLCSQRRLDKPVEQDDRRNRLVNFIRTYPADRPAQAQSDRWVMWTNRGLREGMAIRIFNYFLFNRLYQVNMIEEVTAAKKSTSFVWMNKVQHKPLPKNLNHRNEVGSYRYMEHLEECVRMWNTECHHPKHSEHWHESYHSHDFMGQATTKMQCFQHLQGPLSPL